MKKRVGFLVSLFIALAICEESWAAGQTLVDSRDGKKYTTVAIGNQVWMAKNLNYKTADSHCYKDKLTNCNKFGRLYTWDAALKACPSGWHLPLKAEFEELLKVEGFDASLKVVIPTGYLSNEGYFVNEGKFLSFWTSTEFDKDGAITTSWGYDDGVLVDPYHPDYYKSFGFPVRCVKDQQ